MAARNQTHGTYACQGRSAVARWDTSILLALGAAVSIGTADFLALILTKRIGNYLTLLYTQLPGLVGLSVYWIASGVSFSASWQTWTWALVLVVINLLSALAFYRSMQVGVASTTSPIVASYAAVAVILSVLTGEILCLSHGLGISAALIGVALTALPLDSGCLRAAIRLLTQTY